MSRLRLSAMAVFGLLKLTGACGIRHFKSCRVPASHCFAGWHRRQCLGLERILHGMLWTSGTLESEFRAWSFEPIPFKLGYRQRLRRESKTNSRRKAPPSPALHCPRLPNMRCPKPQTSVLLHLDARNSRLNNEEWLETESG